MSLKENKVTSKKHKRTWRIIGISSAIICLVASGLAVYAYYSMKTEVTNNFEVKLFEVKMEEKFTPPETWDKDDLITKEVTYTNIGSIPAMLRIQTAESWVTADGKALSSVITTDGTAKDVVTKIWGNEGLDKASLWEEHNGWQYYTKLLMPNQTITVLKSIKMDTSLTDYKDATYKLSFLHEYVKSSEVTKLWNASPTISGEEINWGFTTISK